MVDISHEMDTFLGKFEEFDQNLDKNEIFTRYLKEVVKEIQDIYRTGEFRRLSSLLENVESNISSLINIVN